MKKNPKSSLQDQSFWIYALITYSNVSNEKACYIGQTVNLMRRLKEHYKNNRVGKGSYYLQEWAKTQESNVKCVILSTLVGNQQEASVLENYWCRLAQEFGFITPNSENWANSSNADNFQGQYHSWPEESINAKIVGLTDIFEKGGSIQSI